MRPLTPWGVAWRTALLAASVLWGFASASLAEPLPEADSWVAADERIADGDYDGAVRIAEADRAAGPALRRFVERTRATGDSPVVRVALTEAVAAMGEGDLARVLRARAGIAVLPDAVSSFLLLCRGGEAQAALGSYLDASHDYLDASALAGRLGWTNGQTYALRHSGAMADYAGAAEDVLHRWRLLEEVHARAGDAEGAARARADAGSAHAKLGAYGLALALLVDARRALAAAGDRRAEADVLGRIALVHSRRGAYARALAALRQAENVAAQVASPDVRGQLHADLGVVYFGAGESERAAELCRGAHELLSSAGDHVGAAFAMASEANALLELDRVEESRDSFLRVLQQFESLGAKNAAAHVWLNLGELERRRGRHEEALRRLAEAEKRCRALGDPEGIALAKGNTGHVLTELGRFDEAILHQLEALRVARSIGAQQTVAEVSFDIAWAYERLGRHSEAVAQARRGLEAVAGLASGLAEGTGARARAVLAEYHAVGPLAALATNDVATAWELVERGRAGALVEALGGRAAIRDAAVPETLLRREAEARLEAASAAAALREARRAGKIRAIRPVRKAWTEAEEARDRALEDVDAASRLDVLAPAEPIALARLQEMLAPDEVWVTYALYAEQPLAFVVTRAAERVVKLSASLERISVLCGELQPEDRKTSPGDAVVAVRAAVVDPLDLPSKAERVLFVPDGPLGHVAPALLFPGRAVVACPSATAYAHGREAERVRGAHVLGLGDVDYDFKADGFTPLPASGAEVRAVTPGKDDVRLLSPDATEGRLRDELSAQPRWRSIHLAVHGKVDVERPLQSHLAIAPSDGHDGLLTVREVLRLRFESDLVALSACQVGHGTHVAGEGLLGFVRAFLFAGADRVLVSLWNADDDATQTMMVRFYELWNPAEGDGLPAAEALRRAQDHVRATPKWAHPYYWAGWVLWGRGD